MSTAAIAAEATPGRPMLRTACTICRQAPGTSMASAPTTTERRWLSITVAQAGLP